MHWSKSFLFLDFLKKFYLFHKSFVLAHAQFELVFDVLQNCSCDFIYIRIVLFNFLQTLISKLVYLSCYWFLYSVNVDEVPFGVFHLNVLQWFLYLLHLLYRLFTWFYPHTLKISYFLFNSTFFYTNSALFQRLFLNLDILQSLQMFRMVWCGFS